MDSGTTKTTTTRPDEAPSSQPQRPTAACNVHDAQHDLDDPICLKRWWRDYQVMNSMPQINNNCSNDNDRHKITFLRYLANAEDLRSEYGDSAVPIDIRFRVRSYEYMLGIKESRRTEYKDSYDRTRVHDPRRPRRRNQDKQEYEYFEDYKNTWIAPSDSKPCHCFRCKP